jgi:uncharacterized protein YbbK (DUF523 family)
MENNKIIIISACLAGVKCRYDNKDAYNRILLDELKQNPIIISCPEVLGGLPTPRHACNIHGGDGNDVLKGTAKIIGIDGKDYTNAYIEGARKVLEMALKFQVKKAYLKKNSPSCGSGQIYSEDGTKLICGDGVLSALLKQNQIEIISL